MISQSCRALTVSDLVLISGAVQRNTVRHWAAVWHGGIRCGSGIIKLIGNLLCVMLPNTHTHATFEKPDTSVNPQWSCLVIWEQQPVQKYNLLWLWGRDGVSLNVSETGTMYSLLSANGKLKYHKPKHSYCADQASSLFVPLIVQQPGHSCSVFRNMCNSNNYMC